MSSAPKSGDGGWRQGGEEMDIDLDLGEEKVIDLEESEPEAGGARGSAVGAAPELLESSFRELMILEGGSDGAKRAELVSKLEASRTKAAAEERAARRAAWTEETHERIRERRNFQISSQIELAGKTILPEVGDPKEKARLARMSPIWRNALKKQRTTFLFHEAFPVLHAKGCLPRNDILGCRAVSQDWKSSVESWIKNFLSYLRQSLLQKRSAKESDLTDLMAILLRVDATQVATLLDWCQNHSKGPNPFPFRKLRFGCICPHDGQTNYHFWNQADALLTQWGKEVWTLMIQFSRINYFDSAGSYEMVCKLLKLTPNLRQLVLMAFNPIQDSDPLKGSLENNPLPELPQLQSLITINIPPLMVKSMLTKFGSNLDTLFASGVSGISFVGSCLPNLKLTSF